MTMYRRFGVLKLESREEVRQKLEKLTIEKIGGVVITKWDGSVISSVSVSDKYEVFDVTRYFLQKIDQIESNFPINQFWLHISGGTQSLEMFSDNVELAGKIYRKSFFLLSSSDKSRALQLNIGLTSKDGGNKIIFGTKNFSLYKKHLTGVTRAADDVSQVLIQETFDEQIQALSQLVGHRVLLSKLREIILAKDTGVDQKKWISFKRTIHRIYSDRKNLTQSQSSYLWSLSTESPNRDQDFSIDAFEAVNLYLQIFSLEDSHVIKKEAHKILQITTWFVRNEKISELFA